MNAATINGYRPAEQEYVDADPFFGDETELSAAKDRIVELTPVAGMDWREVTRVGSIVGLAEGTKAAMIAIVPEAKP